MSFFYFVLGTGHRGHLAVWHVVFCIIIFYSWSIKGKSSLLHFLLLFLADSLMCIPVSGNTEISYILYYCRHYGNWLQLSFVGCVAAKILHLCLQTAYFHRYFCNKKRSDEKKHAANRHTHAHHRTHACVRLQASTHVRAFACTLTHARR